MFVAFSSLDEAAKTKPIQRFFPAEHALILSR
jgi:hypothetical protein